MSRLSRLRPQCFPQAVGGLQGALYLLHRIRRKEGGAASDGFLLVKRHIQRKLICISIVQ